VSVNIVVCSDVTDSPDWGSNTGVTRGFLPDAAVRPDMSDQRLDADLPLAYVYRPPADESDRLVVVLHGRGADETDLLPVADRLPPAHVVSLRAPDRLMGGYTWYALDVPDGDLHRSQPHAGEFRRSLDLVAEAVDTAREAVGATETGLLGFSQGAITSLSLLVERPDAYDWVVALHGYLAASHADRDADLGGVPVFVGAGSADEIIPASRASDAAARLRELGASVTFETYGVGHGVAREELADVVAFVESR
jgi:phospholipase/carboxylesterase